MFQLTRRAVFKISPPCQSFVPWTMLGCLIFPFLYVEIFIGRCLIPQEDRFMSDYPFVLQADLDRPRIQLKGTHSLYCQAISCMLLGCGHMAGNHVGQKKNLSLLSRLLEGSTYNSWLGQNHILKDSSSGTSVLTHPKKNSIIVPRQLSKSNTSSVQKNKMQPEQKFF